MKLDEEINAYCKDEKSINDSISIMLSTWKSQLFQAILKEGSINDYISESIECLRLLLNQIYADESKKYILGSNIDESFSDCVDDHWYKDKTTIYNDKIYIKSSDLVFLADAYDHKSLLQILGFAREMIIKSLVYDDRVICLSLNGSSGGFNISKVYEDIKYNVESSSKKYYQTYWDELVKIGLFQYNAFAIENEIKHREREELERQHAEQERLEKEKREQKEREDRAINLFLSGNNKKNADTKRKVDSLFD